MKKLHVMYGSLIGIFALSTLVFAQTGTIDNGISTGTGGAQTAVNPVASPAAGSYTSNQSVTLSASGASLIRYTTNGATPACDSGTQYSSAISVTSSQTIKAISCYLEGDGTYSHSNVSSFTYTINIPSSGGGGGGGGSISYCSNVVMSEWGACTSGFQHRQVLSQSPTSCTLSTTQQLALQRTCSPETTTPTPEPNNTGSGTGSSTGTGTTTSPSTSDVDVSAVMNRERLLVKRISTALTNRLLGRILLQVEARGEAWYLEPVAMEKHFMGRPADAFSLMRRFGLGISEINFSKFEKSGAPSRFAGRILIRVEKNGEAYYVNPINLKLYYLGRPDDAFRIMRELALGISNDNLRQIKVAD